MGADLLSGLANALTPEHLLFAAIGALLGTAVGVLPGLGPSSTMAILLPSTFVLPPSGSIIMLAGIYYGAMYGGSTTSVLLNVPGEVASVPTTIDGYQMTKQGRAGQALAIAAIGSFMAGIVGSVIISLIAKPLALFGLKFGPPEYFALILLSLTGIISFSGASIGKGVLAGLAGLFLATVGLDPQSGTERMTYGSIELLRGLDIVAVLIGLFAISEVFHSVGARMGSVYSGKLGSWWSMIPRGAELKSGLAACARGTALGFPFGLIPGMLPAVTTFLAYDVEKRISKTPERFGKGAIEGVAAPEAANNATAMGGFVPLLALGIPTGPSLAILLAAFMAFGLTPGPQLFNNDGLLVWTIIASMLIANIMLLVLNLPLVRMWAMISRVPYSALAPIILGVSVVGAFSSRNAVMDVVTAVVFGFVGLGMKRAGVPPAPLILGLLLGPLLEQSLRQSLSVSAGSPTIFFSHPIALILIIIATVFLVVSLYLKIRSSKAERLLETAAEDAWDS